MFAKERSAAGIKEALFARRTVAWSNNILVGKEEFLRPLVEAAIEVGEAYYDDDKSVLHVELKNRSSSTLVLQNRGEWSFQNRAHIVSLPEHSSLELQIKTLEQKSRAVLGFDVLNAMTAPDTFAPDRSGDRPDRDPAIRMTLFY